MSAMDLETSRLLTEPLLTSSNTFSNTPKTTPETQQFSFISNTDTTGYQSSTNPFNNTPKIVTFQVVTSSSGDQTVNAAMTTFTAANGKKVSVIARKPSDACWLFRQAERILFLGEKVRLFFECKAKGFNKLDLNALATRRKSLINEAESRMNDGESPLKTYVDFYYGNLPSENKHELIEVLKLKALKRTHSGASSSRYDESPICSQPRQNQYEKDLSVIANSEQKIEKLRLLNYCVGTDVNYNLDQYTCPICKTPLNEKNAVILKYTDPISNKRESILASKNGAIKVLAGNVWKKAPFGHAFKKDSIIGVPIIGDGAAVNWNTVTFEALPDAQ